ncbi:MAG TPA: UPF0182 family protein [Terriglobales bacterium]|jgi:hypothetical protein
MITALFVVAIAAVALAAHLQLRRTGRLGPASLLRNIGLAAAALYILIEGSRFWIDFAWWRSLGQTGTFVQYLRIRWLPQTALALVAALLLIAAFRLGRSWCGSPVARTGLFGLVGHVVAGLLGIFLSVNIVDPWTIALYLGARDTGAYTDPLFHKDLAFYFFRLPLYQMTFTWIAALAVAALVVMAVTVGLGSSAERLGQMRERFQAQMEAQMEGRRYTAAVPVPMPVQARATLTGMVRAGAVLLLVLFAVAQFFARYGLLYSDHNFLFGADFVDARLGIPLLWVQIVGALGLAGLILAARRRGLGLGDRFSRRRELVPRGVMLEWLPAGTPGWLAPAVIVAFLVLAIAPALIEGGVRAAYVSPNELSLERPYIVDHIHATRMAFNLEQTAHEEAFTPTPTESIDLANFPDTASNLRLWDAGPFQNDVTQLQALRPYYAFPEVDTDRYLINGQTRQVLIAERALDTDLLPATAQSWVNLRLQYTHGYGAVAAMVNTATPEGQPDLILKDAPPTGPLPDLQITRAGLYFGEDTARSVFVDTKQDEFDYPKGDDNSYTNYSGSAGIVLSHPALRVAAAIEQDDPNILLTHYFTPATRLLMHRQIMDRVETLAPFLSYDPDPYLVIDSHGHLFWMIDAYTTSDQHPYAEPVTIDGQEVNYIRNSVKVTIDAYNGAVHMYVFDPQDPILQAYRNVFPSLFLPRSAMPADLQAHIRYPQELFDAQAQTYRLYHMQDPQVFYNKEDQWDIARQVATQEESQPTKPYYLMLRLPGDTQAEFVLMVPFTSHSRDNLIAWVAARCDPDHYGQLIFYRLPKEQLVYGPLQIESRVDQDRDISKDLSLWNQQGSRVIRATTLVLPVDGTFLYVEPIYIQAPQAKLPELKKVVLAVGNRLVYADDLNSAMAELAQPPGAAPGATPAGASAAASAGAAAGPAISTTLGAGIPRAVGESVQSHLNRYQQLTSQGQFAQAGAELESAKQQLQQALDAAASAVPPKPAKRAAPPRP